MKKLKQIYEKEERKIVKEKKRMSGKNFSRTKKKGKLDKIERSKL